MGCCARSARRSAAPAATGRCPIALSADQAGRGLRATSNKQFVKSTGAAAPVLPAGRKIVVGDMECAAADAATTLCTKGTPAAAWFVVKPGAVEIGPRTAGLPPGYPDPNDFVVGDESYTVGDGAKNVFPAFTVANGLSCRMVLFSGGEIGCNGTLPGVKQGYDEVYVQLPGTAGVRLAGNPPISTPTYSGTVKQLPAGRRIDAYGATCMALTDGGVACFGATGGPPQGFWVSAQKTTTFVGP